MTILVGILVVLLLCLLASNRSLRDDLEHDRGEVKRYRDMADKNGDAAYELRRKLSAVKQQRDRAAKVLLEPSE